MIFDRHMGKGMENGMPRLRASSMEELDHVRIHSHCDLLMLDRGCQKGDSAATVRLGNAHGRLRRFREPLPDIQSGEDGTRAAACCASGRLGVLPCQTVPTSDHDRKAASIIGGAAMAVSEGGNLGGDE